MQRIPITPGDYRELRDVRVTLGGSSFVLAFRWHARLRGWYMDVKLPDGTAVATGRRLSPGWGPVLGLTATGRPAGTLWVQGDRDPYERADLGDRLNVFYIGPDEIVDPVLADSVTVTI